MNFNIPNSSGASASVPNAGVANVPNMGASSSMNMGSNSVFNKQMGIILLVILGIAVVVIIIVVIVNKNKNKNNQNVIIDTPVNAFGLKKNKFTIKNSDLGLEFSYSVWIYIQDWTHGWKNIFVKGSGSPGSTSGQPTSSQLRAPGLWLYPDTNSLHARINTYASPNEGCDIKNIPLQKWVHIGYVLNNRTVDMYIDGKLERSCVLRGVPKLNDSDLIVCDNNGFFGKISNLVYYKYALKPDDIHNIYSSGPY
jgi:hypothetical protein